MPRPVDQSSRFLPGLEGVRALAVALVLAYHLGWERTPGGLLGVGVFFTLSGYLITSLLIRDFERYGRIDLRTFWIRRARRLLPAVVMVLTAVLVATLVTDPSALWDRAKQAVAGFFYVANWATIVSGDSYFAQTAGPQPLGHLWSLAVEEQFYLIWPVLLGGLFVLLRGRLDHIARVTVGLAAASFVLLALLASPGFDQTRAYEGTDTRAGGLLVGAALALVLARSDLTRATSRGRRVLDVFGGLGLVGIVALSMTTTEHSMWLYRGGLVLLTIATATVLVAAIHPTTVTSRVLGVAPLRWVGERSYGIYLWHMPVVAFLPDSVLGTSPTARATVIIALTALLAEVSWRLIEDPIRRNGLRQTIRSGREAINLGFAQPPRIGVTTACILMLAVAAMVVPGRLLPSSHASPAPTPTTQAAGPARPSGLVRTSCQKVIHLGDSTSLGLNAPEVLPKKSQRLRAQVRSVGASSFTAEISGARSIVETYKGAPNAQTVVDRHLKKGYDGCWLFALGTNEAANQAVGGSVSLDDRIDLVMKRIGDQPALWATIRTLKKDGPWAEKHSGEWRAALERACRRYPNMRVYDWAAEVEDGWYIPDGIHFNPMGSAERAHRLATALGVAFPKHTGRPKGCYVRAE